MPSAQGTAVAALLAAVLVLVSIAPAAQGQVADASLHVEFERSSVLIDPGETITVPAQVVYEYRQGSVSSESVTVQLHVVDYPHWLHGVTIQPQAFDVQVDPSGGEHVQDVRVSMRATDDAPAYMPATLQVDGVADGGGPASTVSHTNGAAVVVVTPDFTGDIAVRGDPVLLEAREGWARYSVGVENRANGAVAVGLDGIEGPDAAILDVEEVVVLPEFMASTPPDDDGAGADDEPARPANVKDLVFTTERMEGGPATLLLSASFAPNRDVAAWQHQEQVIMPSSAAFFPAGAQVQGSLVALMLLLALAAGAGGFLAGRRVGEGRGFARPRLVWERADGREEE